MFITSLVDIQKVLANRTKKRTDLCIKLLKHFHKFLNVFDYTRVEKLPPLKGKGINYYIEIKKKND